uniref:C-type lectin domain-containing protein n=1 Tax=Heterorhabditis bacteriophora TaxID=37862 RepID=A0A1I7WLM9_HETBA
MCTRIVFLLLIKIDLLTSCQCSGVEIVGTDQKHCWEVRTRAAKTWVDADITCQRLGGHLGHPQSYNKELIEYINKVYSKPILTGIVVGNVETQKYAMLCPNNVYFGLVDFHEIKQIIAEVRSLILFKKIWAKIRIFRMQLTQILNVEAISGVSLVKKYYKYKRYLLHLIYNFTVLPISPILRYSPEPESSLLPPSAVVTQPIFVPIPMQEKRDSLIYNIKTENSSALPPKVECRTIGTNTDPIDLFVPKRNKKVFKSKQYFLTLPNVPFTPEFMDDDTLADDVSLELEHLSGPDSEPVLPCGDVPPIVPTVFLKNTKPLNVPRKSLSSVKRPELNGESPIDFSSNNQLIRSNSSPTFIKTTGPFNFGTRLPTRVTPEKPKVEKRPWIPHSVVPTNSYQKRPESRLAGYSNHPFSAKVFSTSTPVKKFPSKPSTKKPILAKKMTEISMLAPKGKMGGVVKAGGGGGGETPVGWKPWAKSSDTFNTQPQFLSDDLTA